MPLHKSTQAAYHTESNPAREGRVVGKQEILNRFPSIKNDVFRAVTKAFPVALTRSWLSRSSGKADDALLLQALPQAKELLRTDGDRPDPVGDQRMSSVPWLVQKHPDRALLLVTKRCHLYCRYCFRRDHQPGAALDPTPQELEFALSAAISSGARELILSGGDPLSLTNSALGAILHRAKTHFAVTRIHTRAPITAPDRVDEGLLELVREHAPLWIVVHANHPDELSDTVLHGLEALRRAGASMLNQSVLLKGVNDDVAVLRRLSERLVEHGIFPYYLHHTDPVPGNAHFRVSPTVGLRIHRELSRQVSGVALPRYVVDLEDGSGKIPVSEAQKLGLLM